MEKKKEGSLSDSEISQTLKSGSSRPLGESLQTCTDGEWDASDEPYSAELLNVKKKPNRVNVFSATEKNLDTIIVTEESSTALAVSPKPPTEHHNLARLIQKACKVLLESPNGEGAEVHVKLEFEDWRNNKCSYNE